MRSSMTQGLLTANTFSGGAGLRQGLSCPEDAWGWPTASGLFLVPDTGRKMLFSLKMYVYLTRSLFALQSGFHSVSYHSN